MTIGSKEFYEIIEMFDKEYKGYRLDKEDKSMWMSGNVYQNGEVNMLFRAYQKGYSLARCVYQNQ